MRYVLAEVETLYNKRSHVVVIGAMGVGKTTVARMLSAELGMPFLDSDEVLESRTGETGAAIAARDGVDRLHEIELEVFLDMARNPSPAVIAPASSVVDHELGRRVLEENLTVWLTAADDVIAQRQASGNHRRPVGLEARGVLEARRAPWLAELKTIKIDTSSATPEAVVRLVVDQLSL